MKVLILILGVIATSQAVSLQRGLAQDLEDFKALLPLDELNDLYDYYLRNDENFREVLSSFASEDAMKAYQDVFSVPEVREFLSWVTNNWSFREARLYRLLSLKAHAPGFSGYVDEALDLLPLDKLWELASKKVEEGGPFAELYFKLQESQPVYDKVLSLPSVTKFLNNLKALGVDFDRLNAFVHTVFGWS